MIDNKDFAHYYIGQPVKVGRRVIARLTVDTCDSEHVALYQVCQNNAYKLILRPLEDLREDELESMGFAYKEAYDIWLWENRYNSKRLGKSLFQFTPKQFHFLLSRGFDLFYLIESGSVLDRTKLLDETSEEMVANLKLHINAIGEHLRDTSGWPVALKESAKNINDMYIEDLRRLVDNYVNKGANPEMVKQINNELDKRK